MKRGLVICALVGLAILAGGGVAVSGVTTVAKARRPAHWVFWLHVTTPIDLVGPRSDGALVLAANGRLWLLRRSERVHPFASAYHGPGGEPYIALAPGSHKGCSFGRNAVYALHLSPPTGITEVTAGGRVHNFAAITAPGLLNGIAFDETGKFGYRLLVTINAGLRTTVDAVNCRGAVQTITTSAPRVEGGIVVAPKTFGRYSGDLIAPDELSGRVYAIRPRGGHALVANSGLPFGQDTGVESEAFLPMRSRFDAFLSDRLTPGNPHPGDDEILRVGSAALFASGARPGDLLVATEGGARTVAIRCGRRRCQVRHVADGPAIAHGEGHIAILPR